MHRKRLPILPYPVHLSRCRATGKTYFAKKTNLLVPEEQEQERQLQLQLQIEIEESWFTNNKTRCRNHFLYFCSILSFFFLFYFRQQFMSQIVIKHLSPRMTFKTIF